MKKHYVEDAWSIIEEGFHPEMQRSSESIFSLGNGHMGQRANFEEKYTGTTLQGNYVAGVYYPDKTRVGWWKNGYPEYFAKVLNAANWIGIDIEIDGKALDLAKARILHFRRELDMKGGVLSRNFGVEFEKGKQLEIKVLRFLSIVEKEAGLIKYSLTPIGFEPEIMVRAYIDGDVQNQDANYEEKFWQEVAKGSTANGSFVSLKTKKLDFEVTTAQRLKIDLDGRAQSLRGRQVERNKFVSNQYDFTVAAGRELTIYKYAVNVSSLHVASENQEAEANRLLDGLTNKGFDTLMAEHSAAWQERWKMNDIVIHGDVAAQQAIRFNIYQLNQTYSGEDARLNIGPKGFTGEKYGGGTYWDTEAYCLPFYLLTAGSEVAKNLLRYRYRQLDKAIDNARKLGFSDGAALYPMVTMNGEECHNEWEITFEEIHRNGAIAFAIYNFIRHTSDYSYLYEGGLEVLLAIARFWKQRVNWSKDKQAYVMLGVTGPNEYENNVNNNWYTNYIARWTLQYTAECIATVQSDAKFWSEFKAKTNFDLEELTAWSDIVEKIYQPKLAGTLLYLQQDGFLDKEDQTVADLDPSHRPINQKWSWDRILRSVFIKQADVLQGMYFFEDHFDIETIRENFLYYESRTVHESSLSPCVHSVLACKLDMEEKAYEMYLRTSRLDLDDYNHEADEGLHITSMAGTWMAVIEGFGGKRIRDGVLSFDPMIPKHWDSYSFNLVYRGSVISITVNTNEVTVENKSSESVKLKLYSTAHEISGSSTLSINR